MMVMYLQMFRNFATGLFGFSRIFSSGITPGLVGICTAQPPISSVAGSGNEDTAGLVSSVNAAPSNADIDSPANPDMAIAEGSGNVDRESEDWTDGAHQDNAENEICMSRAAKLAPSGYADCLHRGILALASNTLFLRNCCNHFIDFHDIPANLLAEIKDKNFVYERMSNRELCSSILDDIEEARRYINEFQRSIATNFSFQPLKDVVPQDVLNLEPLFSFITECHVAPSKQAISQVLSEFEAEAETTHIKAIDESYPKMLLLYLSYVERYVKELSDKARELWNNQDFVKILPEVVKKSDSSKAKGQTSHKMSKIAEDARKKELEGSKQKKEALSTKPSANSERDGLEEQKSNPNENAANITRSTQIVPNNSVPSTHAKGEKDEVAEVGQSKASMQDKSAAKTKKLLARLSNSKTERQNREEFWEELNDKLREQKKKIEESEALNRSRSNNQGIEDANASKVPANSNGDNRQDSDSNEEFHSTTESFGTSDKHGTAENDQSRQPVVQDTSDVTESPRPDDSLLVKNKGRLPPLGSFAINKTEEQQNKPLKTTSDEPHDRSLALMPVYADKARSDVPKDEHNYHRPTGNGRQQDRSRAVKNDTAKNESSKADSNKSPQADNPKKDLKPSSKRNYGLVVFFVVGCAICLAVGVFIYLVIFK